MALAMTIDSSTHHIHIALHLKILPALCVERLRESTSVASDMPLAPSFEDVFEKQLLEEELFQQLQLLKEETTQCKP